MASPRKSNFTDVHRCSQLPESKAAIYNGFQHETLSSCVHCGRNVMTPRRSKQTNPWSRNQQVKEMLALLLCEVQGLLKPDCSNSASQQEHRFTVLNPWHLRSLLWHSVLLPSAVSTRPLTLISQEVTSSRSTSAFLLLLYVSCRGAVLLVSVALRKLGTEPVKNWDNNSSCSGME